MLYIIPNYYEPNTAATNRFLALISGISKCLNKDDICEVELFLPNQKCDKIDIQYPNVVFNYRWCRKWYFRGRYSKYITHEIAIKAFVKKLKVGDCVLLLGHAELLPIIQKKKGVSTYFEMNEFPELFSFGNGLRKISNDNLIECCRKLDGLFVISTHLKDYFSQKGVSKEIIHLYRMTVDEGRFHNLEKLPQAIPYIAYCGTVSNFKDGVDILLNAFSLVKKQHKEPLKLYIIGRVPSETEKRKNLELIEQLGIKDDVVLTGSIQAEEMPQMLKNAEALVLARPDNIQAKYGFPTKLGEYLLTANPVVVTAVGDIPLYLKDGNNALVAAPNNPQAIADRILWAIKNKNEAAIMGEKGRQTAMEFFNADIEAAHILKVITEEK